MTSFFADLTPDELEVRMEVLDMDEASKARMRSLRIAIRIAESGGRVIDLASWLESHRVQ